MGKGQRKRKKRDKRRKKRHGKAAPGGIGSSAASARPEPEPGSSEVSEGPLTSEEQAIHERAPRSSLVNSPEPAALAEAAPEALAEAAPEPAALAEAAPKPLERKSRAQRRRERRLIPTPLSGNPRAFTKGALVGLLGFIPAMTAAILVLSHLGLTRRNLGVLEALVITATFAGLPALLCGGSLGRLALRTALLSGRRWALAKTVINGAACGAGLAILAGVPVGGLPEQPQRWAWLGVAGAVAIAVVAWPIGLWLSSTVAAQTASSAASDAEAEAAAEPAADRAG